MLGKLLFALGALAVACSPVKYEKRLVTGEHTATLEFTLPYDVPIIFGTLGFTITVDPNNHAFLDQFSGTSSASTWHASLDYTEPTLFGEWNAFTLYGRVYGRMFSFRLGLLIGPGSYSDERYALKSPMYNGSPISMNSPMLRIDGYRVDTVFWIPQDQLTPGSLFRTIAKSGFSLSIAFSRQAMSLFVVLWLFVIAPTLIEAPNRHPTRYVCIGMSGCPAECAGDYDAGITTIPFTARAPHRNTLIKVRMADRQSAPIVDCKLNPPNQQLPAPSCTGIVTLRLPSTIQWEVMIVKGAYTQFDAPDDIRLAMNACCAVVRDYQFKYIWTTSEIPFGRPRTQVVCSGNDRPVAGTDKHCRDYFASFSATPCVPSHDCVYTKEFYSKEQFFSSSRVRYAAEALHVVSREKMNRILWLALVACVASKNLAEFCIAVASCAIKCEGEFEAGLPWPSSYTSTSVIDKTMFRIRLTQANRRGLPAVSCLSESGQPWTPECMGRPRMYLDIWDVTAHYAPMDAQVEVESKNGIAEEMARQCCHLVWSTAFAFAFNSRDHEIKSPVLKLRCEGSQKKVFLWTCAEMFPTMIDSAECSPSENTCAPMMTRSSRAAGGCVWPQSPEGPSPQE
ncbi:uncharacterized protein L969DRAFT_95222 [Mixia osmundae IAM 14324]|uniref:Uncharacterized protein n=1 Tax=Mixia osmundae (strain CBS 9802 / IAM 14324 / JCM 22182 / KY 12970) TaxID=764103 RepID=G7E6T2_MIXOS|nr:uncharacterized protein L969DRAFT_95222 [Mixia osmundae IAM 14324]KEI39075.1 hypothetical protein L969DRAFT_95222 [Mixia osmundae IAM 14324]GAA98542.1 hypothetical protein E5Q_05229 [Mixia osmundae IAM 14324]